MFKKTEEMGGYQANENIPKLPTTLSDHPSLVGIIRLPFCNVQDKNIDISLPFLDGEVWKMVTQSVDMATTITQIPIEDASFTINKNSITDFYPYTYYVLTDGESEPLIMKPQYMPTECTVCGKFALSNQPIERYFVKGYKGDNDGRIYNITNLNQMMLPCATNEGANFLNANANTIMQNRKNTITSNILNSVSNIGATIGSLGSGNMSLAMGVGLNGISSAINGINQIKQIDARNKDLLLTPSSISSFGTPSTRNAFNNNSVRVLKYTIDDKIKSKVLNFTKRYGNKYNNFSTIDLKSYKGYIKIIEPNIDSKIDNIHINKIREILERGVYCE